MAKVTFVLQEVRETPNALPKLNIEMTCEPAKLLKEDSHLRKLSDEIIKTIDAFNNKHATKVVASARKY